MIVRQNDSCVVSDYADRIGLVKSLSELPMDLFSQEVDVDSMLDSVEEMSDELVKFAAFLEGLKASDL